MIRIVIENVLLLLLPTAMYIAYVMLTRRGEDPKRGVLDDAPLIWLFACGAVLVVTVLVVFGSTTGGKPNQGYVPPSLDGGHVNPGQIR
ncbi:MAG: DUF6111 family protein [Hyphomicrobiaceae bacterium]|jgi:hypothetical protein